MRKLIVVIALSAIAVGANAQSRWSVGVQTGCMTNVAKFSSGDEEANALFSNNHFKSAQVGVNFRYSISDRFSFQSGFQFTEIGFSYSMAKDYSLVDFQRPENDLRSSTCITSIPAMMVMQTPFNCLNSRFIFGLGGSVKFMDNKWDTEKQSEVTAEEGNNTGITYLTHESRTKAGVSPSINWMIGIEKVLLKGNILRFSFQASQGLTTVAESDVNYMASNKNYHHTFINRGSTASFSLGYFFQPIGSRRALKN